MDAVARLVFLGRLADVAGRTEATVACPASLGWGDVVAWLASHGGADLADAVGAARVRVALNGVVLAEKATLVLVGGDELAFLPPVSGG
jgi:molybdopterin synthase sulfur carrier subunit